MNSTELLSCPFCGWHMNGDMRDIVYPTGSYAHYIDPQHPESGLHFNRDPHGAVHTVYHVGCTENMGGCGASVLGLGRAGAVAAWNRRASINSVVCEAGGWRPIETAPKDGTPIIVTNPERGGVWIAKYEPVYTSGYRPENPWFSLMLNTHWHPNRWGSFVPTHWQVLPPPPGSARDSAEADKTKAGGVDRAGAFNDQRGGRNG